MKRRLLFAIWLCIATYTLLMAIWGPSGQRAQRQAMRSEQAMRENLEALELLHAEYSSLLAYYSQRPDAMRMEARSLGWVDRQEVVLRIEQPHTSLARPAVAGEMVEHSYQAQLTNAQAARTAALIGAMSGLCLLLLCGLGRALRRRGEPRRPSRPGFASARPVWSGQP